MANAPFDRLIINPREKPLSEDINQGSSQLDRALRFFAEVLFSNPDNGSIQEGFINNSFLVVANSPAGMSVRVKRGLGFQLAPVLVANAINGVVGLDDFSDYKPIPLLNDHVFSVPDAPAAPNTRIDHIEVKADFLVTDPQMRQVFNVASGVFSPTAINKILTWLLDGRTETIKGAIGPRSTVRLAEGLKSRGIREILRFA